MLEAECVADFMQQGFPVIRARGESRVLVGRVYPDVPIERAGRATVIGGRVGIAPYGGQAAVAAESDANIARRGHVIRLNDIWRDVGIPDMDRVHETLTLRR